jgi:hypothetical protein
MLSVGVAVHSSATGDTVTGNFLSAFSVVSSPGSATSSAKHDGRNLDEVARTSHTQPSVDPACLCGHTQHLLMT